MNNTLKTIFTLVIAFVFAGCSTFGGNKISNETLYGAIVEQGNKQNETLSKIVELLATQKTAEVKKPAPEATTNAKRFTFGNTVSDEEILGTSVSLKKSERTATVSTENPFEKRITRLENRVFTTEKIVSNHKKRLDSLEKFDRKLAWEISQVGIDNFPGINVGKFAKGSAKVSSEIESQIQAVAKRYNSAIGNRTDTLTIVVTGHDDSGNISEKRGNAVAKVLKRFLNKNFSTTIATTPSGNYPGKVSISNPFTAN